MAANELLRLVDTIHRDKNMDKDNLFKAIDAPLVSAAKKHYGEDAEIVVEIDRALGSREASASHCAPVRPSLRCRLVLSAVVL